MGGSFLKVDYEEDGSGQGGYAKEMSDGYKEAERQLMLKATSEADVVITTALIPGRPAPKLVSQEMLDGMREGSVVLDMAANAETGGNCVGSVAGGKAVVSGVTVIGYTDLPSRLPATSSEMFAKNIYNFVTSLGQTKGKELPENHLWLDLEDDAVNCMLVAHDGENRWPTPMYNPPPPPPKAEVVEAADAAEAAEEADPKAEFVEGAALAAGVAGALVASGLLSHDPSTSSLLASFMLSSYAGYMVVWGVAPALHSPLMAETNAISGMTAVGGLALLLAEHSEAAAPPAALALGTLATFVSAVNIVGGFRVTQAMLDLFKRPDDPEEHYGLYAAPAALAAAGTVGATFLGAGAEQMPTVAGAGAAVSCIAGIGGLADMSTARMGNVLGMTGVFLGLTATFAAYVDGGADATQVAESLAILGAGGAVGWGVAGRVSPIELPQTVAAFHSLVGVAAVAAAVGEYLASSSAGGGGGLLDAGALTALSAAVFIGGVTTTGSLVAFGKLSEMLPSKAVALPAKDAVNLGLLGACGLAAASVVGVGGVDGLLDPTLALGGMAAASGLLGALLTSSVGGADMPVVITVLNSYSGWALCAEGFLLGNPLLSSVGALIGFSGAILTKIMCDAMNRDIATVIFGGAPAPAAAASSSSSGDEAVVERNPHTEIVSKDVAAMLVAAKEVRELDLNDEI
jgi:NAD(P) transhydrogenase